MSLKHSKFTYQVTVSQDRLQGEFPWTIWTGPRPESSLRQTYSSFTQTSEPVREGQAQ
jgi:hypothetical protein